MGDGIAGIMKVSAFENKDAGKAVYQDYFLPNKEDFPKERTQTTFWWEGIAGSSVARTPIERPISMSPTRAKRSA